MGPAASDYAGCITALGIGYFSVVYAARRRVVLGTDRMVVGMFDTDSGDDDVIFRALGGNCIGTLRRLSRANLGHGASLCRWLGDRCCVSFVRLYLLITQ